MNMGDGARTVTTRAKDRERHMNFPNRLTQDYRDRVKRLRAPFPAAHQFLERLAAGSDHGLWLGTSVNAHLYKRDAFLAYIQTKSRDQRPPSLMLSPHFNHQIFAHTTDRAMLLFGGPLDEVITRHRGENSGWMNRDQRGRIELTADTPGEFFDDLYDALAELVVDG